MACWIIRSNWVFWLLLLSSGYLEGENSVGGFNPMRQRLPISNMASLTMHTWYTFSKSILLNRVCILSIHLCQNGVPPPISKCNSHLLVTIFLLLLGLQLGFGSVSSFFGRFFLRSLIPETYQRHSLSFLRPYDTSDAGNDLPRSFSPMSQRMIDIVMDCIACFHL